MAKLKDFRLDSGDGVRLKNFDPADTSLAPGGKHDTAPKSVELQRRIGELQELLFAEHEHKLLVILQGMDTSGKDGTVKHVFAEASLSGVSVTSFGKPSVEELEHDYLWRIHRNTPGTGKIGVFNRSHYEDVLVVRVHNLVPPDVWKLRYDHINAFEKMLVESGTLVMKFFLNISRDEQKERLQARIDDPTKRWKYEHGDLEERKLWDSYMDAYESVLQKTSTEWAPWHVIPADKKWYRNYVVSRFLVDALDALEMKWPAPDLSAEKVV